MNKEFFFFFLLCLCKKIKLYICIHISKELYLCTFDQIEKFSIFIFLSNIQHSHTHIDQQRQWFTRFLSILLMIIVVVFKHSNNFYRMERIHIKCEKNNNNNGNMSSRNIHFLLKSHYFTWFLRQFLERINNNNKKERVNFAIY